MELISLALFFSSLSLLFVHLLDFDRAFFKALIAIKLIITTDLGGKVIGRLFVSTANP